MDVEALLLPTPDTSHVPYNRVYEPAEDSFLLLDTLSAPAETAFLARRFSSSAGGAPLVVEVGTGSGVVIAFVTAHARALFGNRRGPDDAEGNDESPDVLTAGVDVNAFACAATETTVRRAAEKEATRTGGVGHARGQGFFLGAVNGDLVAPLRRGVVDVLVFNPPYVPTDELPALADNNTEQAPSDFERDSRLLALSYAGGKDGMETTDRLLGELPTLLSARGCAYVLLCARNMPDRVKERVRGFGPGWRAETAGDSGARAGWEKLQVIRIWRERDIPEAISYRSSIDYISMSSFCLGVCCLPPTP